MDVILVSLLAILFSSTGIQSKLSSNLAQSVTAVLQEWKDVGAVETNVEVKFQKDNVINDLASSLQYNGFPISVWWSSDQRQGKQPDMLDSSTYNKVATYVFVGSQDWLQTEMNQVISLSKQNKMNTQKNKFLLVSQETETFSNITEKWRFDLMSIMPEGSRMVLIEPAEEIGKGAMKVYTLQFSTFGKAELKKTGRWTSDVGLEMKYALDLNTITEFNGREIVLVVVHKPKVLEALDSNGKFVEDYDKLGGYISVFVKIILTKLNLKPKVKLSNSFGRNKNGTGTGMVGMLLRKEAEVSVMDFSPTYTRTFAIDFSEWFSTDPAVIFSKSPSVAQSPFLLLQIFSIFVWCSLLASAIIAGFCIFLLEYAVTCIGGYQKTSTESNDGGCEIYQMMSTIFKIFVLQSSIRWPQGSSSRLLGCFVFFGVVSLYAFYQGNIIAFLAVPRRSPSIDSPADLLTNIDAVTPIARPNTAMHLFIQSVPRYSPINDKVGLYSLSQLNTEEFFKNIEEGAFALLDTYSSAIGRAAKFEIYGEACKFQVSKEPMKGSLDLMAYSKNVIYRKHFDRIIFQLKSFGIVEHLKLKYFKAACEKNPKGTVIKSMSLIEMQTAFYVLVLGLTLSCSGFAAEILFARWTKRSQLEIEKEIK